MAHYVWKLKELQDAKQNGLNVFSCFSCGGGSSMGYKLAGYDVIGNCEIDPEMMEIYRSNLTPSYPYQMDIRDFNRVPDAELPNGLFDLDILDGSPPCSTFSVAGDREDAWGKEKTFREGQSKQTLDDLFFHFLKTVEKLKPKVVVAENVKGMVLGKAKGYVKLVIEELKRLNYEVQIFLLNAANMGVPQRRERVFFIARKKQLKWPDLKLNFNERPIKYKEVKSNVGPSLNPKSKTYKRWVKRKPKDNSMGDISQRIEGKAKNFNTVFLKDNIVPPTIAGSSGFLRFDEPRYISTEDIIKIQSFPQDYDFKGAPVQYVCGMSVPPIMMHRIAEQINLQWFKK